MLLAVVPVLTLLLAGATLAGCCLRRRARIIKAQLSGFADAATRLRGSTAADLLVIIDFDRTITDGTSAQCHDVIGATAAVAARSPQLSAGFAELLDFSQVPLPSYFMDDAWWVKANELLLEHGTAALSPAMLREIVTAAPMFGTSTQPMQLRPGADALLARLAALRVPVLICSAGFANIIDEFFLAHGMAVTDNMRVCSNRLVHDGSRLCAVEPSPPITSFNKAQTYERNREWIEAQGARSQVLVIGDSLGDVKCADGVPATCCVTSVGVFNTNGMRAPLTKYKETFTAVVEGDYGSLDPVCALIDSLRSC